MRLPGTSRSARSTTTPSGVVFRKRVYDLAGLTRDLRGLRPIGRNVWAVYGRRRIDPAFRERLMVAVAEVNSCRYCSYAHHEWALVAGVDPAELDPAGGLHGHAQDPREAVAVAYVQTRAEAEFAPASPGVEARLAEVFTAPERRDIETTARIMRIFNLAANTVDALHARRRGERVDGPLLQQLLIGTIAFPIIAVAVAGLAIAKGVSPAQGWRDLDDFSVAFNDRGTPVAGDTPVDPFTPWATATVEAQKEVALP